jgi:uncharacterized MAPEG superfamily protein
LTGEQRLAPILALSGGGVGPAAAEERLSITNKTENAAMLHVSLNVLIGFCAWTLFLLILMEALRGRLVIGKTVAANAFKPDNANLSPFMQRLARAHANCVESLPVFGALLLAAIATGRTGVTDPLAPWLLLARIVQSCVHLASLSVAAVNVRFAAFAVQVAIAVYWTFALFQG